MILLVLTVISGLLLALSLPPFDHEWLGWLAVAPLLVAAQGRRPLEAFGMGLLAGVVCGAVHVGWFPELGEMQFAYLPFLWLAIVLGVVAALAALARQQWQGTAWVLFVACAATAVEWLTTFSPLPVHLALCQYKMTGLIQIAAFTGIWGVSFLLWAFNAALADAVRSRGYRKKKALAGPSARADLARGVYPPSPLVSAVTALLLTLGYGYLALARSARRPTNPILRVAAIQELQPGETAPFLPPAADEGGDREEMTRQAASRGARLIVWPEGSLGATFRPDEREDETLALARRLGQYLVVGYSGAAEPRPFNCAALVAPDGRILGVHRKIHPFLGETRAIQCGRTATAFDTPLGKIGIEICFDSCYPAVTRQVARAGARLIAMPNWDPPAPRGVLHRLHSAMLPFRAVENHVPFVRADANGLSQIVDARGRIKDQAPLYASATLIDDVVLGDGRGTLFTRLGDWWAYLCLLIVAGFSLAVFRSQVAVRTTSSTAGASE